MAAVAAGAEVLCGAGPGRSPRAGGPVPGVPPHKIAGPDAGRPAELLDAGDHDRGLEPPCQACHLGQLWVATHTCMTCFN